MANDVAELVSALVAAAEESCDGVVDRIQIDVQSSGEFPFRIHHSGDQHPDVGCAHVAEVSRPTPSKKSTGAVGVREATTRG